MIHNIEIERVYENTFLGKNIARLALLLKSQQFVCPMHGHMF